MSDLTKITPGDRLTQWPARTHNKLVDGERRDRQRPGQSPSQLRAMPSPVTARIIWDGASAIDPGSIVKLGAAAFDPTTDPTAPFAGLAFHANTWSAVPISWNYAIVTSHVEPGGTCLGILPQAYWAQVDILDPAHMLAQVESGAVLHTDAEHGLPVIWKPAGSGVKWCVIGLENERYQLIRGTTVGAVTPANPTFQINVTADFGQFARSPSSPVTVAAPPGGVTLASGDTIWAAYHKNYIDGVDWVMLTTGSLDLGCHLKKDAGDGSIYVDATSLAGTGLSTETDPETGCQRLSASGVSVTAGCGINIVANVVSVDPADLAGAGLIVGTGCALDVNVGCGLEIVTDEVRVNPADFAGKGLHEVTGSQCDELELDLGCGLQFDAQDKVAVKNGDLAGSGLGTEGTCGLKVNVGCGLEIVSDAVQVKLKPSGGLQCTPDGLATNIGVGCGLDFAGDVIFFDAATVAGGGLGVEGVCSLKVNTGCGLDIVGDAVVVDPADLAGSGLGVEGACGLKVNVGCGLEISGDQVKVNAADLAGEGLAVEGGTGSCALQVATNMTIKNLTGCMLELTGGTLKLTLNYQNVQVYGVAGSSGSTTCTVATTGC